MGTAALVILIVAGSLTFAGLLTFVIVSGVRRATARQIAELAQEGIVLDSGSVRGTFHFQGFRGPMVAISSGVRTGPSRLVLTQEKMAFVPSGQNRFGFAVVPRNDLRRFEVGVKEGRLHLRSDDPPNASGTVEIHLSVSDPAAWVAALTRAGATSKTT